MLTQPCALPPGSTDGLKSLFPLRKADVSKVIEARRPEEFTKEAVDAKLSTF